MVHAERARECHGSAARPAGIFSDTGAQVCESPAYHLEFTNGLSPAIEDLTLQGDGNGQWAENVSFHGTLNEGVFTVDE